jgi:hypothetical protein
VGVGFDGPLEAYRDRSESGARALIRRACAGSDVCPELSGSGVASTSLVPHFEAPAQVGLRVGSSISSTADIAKSKSTEEQIIGFLNRACAAAVTRESRRPQVGANRLVRSCAQRGVPCCIATQLDHAAAAALRLPASVSSGS